MIKLNDFELKFSNMGYFTSEKEWIHPKRTIDTYEIIFVTNGQVFICEDKKKYILNKGDVLVLHPYKLHFGYKQSENVSFFWLHFYCKNYDSIGEFNFHLRDHHNYKLLFRKLNHLAALNSNYNIIECELLLMLLNHKYTNIESNKLFYEISDYIRVNIASAPTVSSIAQKFNYSSDHLSKIFIKNCGINLKKYIDNERNNFVKSLLINTNLPINKVAIEANFIDDRALMKFFKYNNNQTPTEFRSKYYATHTNNK